MVERPDIQSRPNNDAVAAADALRAAAARLAEVSATPRLDAELLMAHAAGLTRDALLLQLGELAAPPGFEALVKRRLAHEPVAYITGRRAFWTVALEVGPGVLVPRADSETLIEAAVLELGAPGPGRVLDLGCGPGTLLLAALDQWPRATGVGVERSAAARDFAQRNVARLDMAARATIIAGDWTRPGWAISLGRFDLVLANPPYVADGVPLMAEVADHEPAEALYAGPDGLADYRCLMPAMCALLEPDGVAILEIGHDQAEAVEHLAEAAGFDARIVRDLGGRDRALVLRRRGGETGP